jgi:hypothetical protein
MSIKSLSSPSHPHSQSLQPEDVSFLRSLGTLFIFCSLEVALLKRHRVDIPDRDLTACKWALFGLILAFNMFAAHTPTLLYHKTQRFTRIFATLSLLEVAVTLILPWVLIAMNWWNDDADNKRNLRLLVSHLFVFQAQIAFEALIMMGGNSKKWILFPYTCIANGYRGIPLAIWMSRVCSSNMFSQAEMVVAAHLISIEFLLPFFAVLLWTFSSFVFIPFVWFPLLRKQATTSQKD